jgi:hypothetical protein
MMGFMVILNNVVKRVCIARFLLAFFFYSSPSFSAVTTQYFSSDTDSYNACVAQSPAGVGSCGSYSNIPWELCSGTGSNMRQRVKTSGSDTYVFKGCLTGTDCANGNVMSSSTGLCECPSGYVSDGNGGCVSQPADCSSEQISLVCENTVCTGSYIAPVLCWLPSGSAPQGCEAGTQSFAGCSPVCPGESTENPVTHACDDPVCVQPEYLINHSCSLPPACIGSQTRNTETGGCDEPVCGAGFSVNSTTHNCDFTGCPTGFKSGTISGSLVCVASTAASDPNQPQPNPSTCSGTVLSNGTCDTNNDGLGDQPITDPAQKTPAYSGPLNASGAYDTNNDGVADTSGLARESTQQSLLDKLTEMVGKSTDFDAQRFLNEGQSSMLDSENEAASNLSGTTNEFESLGGVASSWLPDLPNTSSCTGTINMSWHGKTTLFDPCVKLAPLREVLGWAFYVMTAWFLFLMAFRGK